MMGDAASDPTVHLLIADVSLLLGFWWLIQRTLIAPRKARDQEFFNRLDQIEKAHIKEQGWREAHDALHIQTTAKIDTLISSMQELNNSFHDLDKRMSMMENRSNKI